MNFIALAAFGAIVTGTSAALDRRLHRPAIEDCSRRHFLSAIGDPQDGPEVMGNRFKDLSFEPTLCLLVDDIPRWQIVRHQAPGRAATYHPPQAVENLTEWILALRSVFGH